MHFSVIALSLLSLGGLVSARPGTKISIEIDLDDYTSISPKADILTVPSCRFSPIELCDEDGEIEFDGTDCPKYCSCDKGGLSCKAAEGPLCDAAAITRFCENIAVCLCSKSDSAEELFKAPVHRIHKQQPIAATGVTCPKKEPFEVECGDDFTSTKDCPNLCSCTDGKLNCGHSTECDKASVEFMCGVDVAGCHC